MFVIKSLLFIKIIQGLEVYQGEVVGYPTICLPSPPPSLIEDWSSHPSGLAGEKIRFKRLPW